MMAVDVVDGVATVRLDYLLVNALDLELLDAIVATMGHLDGPVVVTGAGKCFSAGVDLRAIVDGGSEYTDRFIPRCPRPYSLSSTTPRRWSLWSTGMPSRGCVFAMAADVRLMSAGTIGITELAVGVPFPMAGLYMPLRDGEVGDARSAAGRHHRRRRRVGTRLDRRGGRARRPHPAGDRGRARTRTARPNCVRGHEGAAAPTGSHGDRRPRGNGCEGARQLDVGRHARPRHRVYRRASRD